MKEYEINSREQELLSSIEKNMDELIEIIKTRKNDIEPISSIPIVTKIQDLSNKLYTIIDKIKLNKVFNEEKSKKKRKKK